VPSDTHQFDVTTSMADGSCRQRPAETVGSRQPEPTFFIGRRNAVV